MEETKYKQGITAIFAKAAIVMVFFLLGIIFFYSAIRSAKDAYSFGMFGVAFWMLTGIFYLVFFKRNVSVQSKANTQ